MFGLLSQYWLDEHHADGEVLLATNHFAEQQHGCNYQNVVQHVVARIPIHCIVVSSASPYFSALLGPAWQQQVQTQRTAVQLVLPDAADAAAMIALLKCIYTGQLDISAADIEATLEYTSPGGSNAVQECFASQHWQQLYLRVIRLADQYAVHGVMNVAVNKLTSLFSHQLQWPTIEAVLWMPPSLGLSQEPHMAALRQLAVVGVKQKLGVLDTALAQPAGRHMLQCLPPDVLAHILSCDTLLATSENTVLAAIDTWLAGPVAANLAQQTDILTAAAGTANATQGVGMGTATCLGSNITNTSSGSGIRGRGFDSSQWCFLEGSGESEDMDSHSSIKHSALQGALELLMGSVRFNQCTGPFMAAAAGRMPWLCAALQHKAQDLQLMQQYYRSDSEGRYQLSMQLIQQTINCPWQPKHRKALPTGFNPSSSITGQPGTRTLLSELRTLLDTSRSQQLVQKVLLYKSLTSPAAPTAGVPLQEFVSGGYVWRLSLVAAPLKRLRPNPGQNGTGVGDAEASITQSGTDLQHQHQQQQQQQQQQQLALCIICRPAWATNLALVGCSGSSVGSDRGKDNAGVGVPTGPEAATPMPTQLKAAAAAAAGPEYECTAGWAQCSTDAAAPSSTDLSSSCKVCRDVRSIAACKAAAAVTRHLGATNTSSSSSSSSSSDDPSQGGVVALARVEVQDVLVGVNVVAAPSTQLLQGLVASNASRAPADAFVAVRLAWSEVAGAAYGLVPLDINGISSGSGNLVCGWGCSPQQLPTGAVQVARPAATAGAAAAAAVWGGAGLGGGVAGVGGGGSLVVGWQPELWSAVAYTGELHWHCSIRVLSD